jgi:integrase
VGKFNERGQGRYPHRLKPALRHSALLAGGPNTEKVDETFPTITPHDLRHTAASVAISSGANVKAVQRMLGHAKASMTLDVYADLFDDDLDVVASRLDDAIIKTNTTSKPASMQNAAD